MPFELVVSGHFSAAHRIPHYPGDCERMHGHNYGVDVVLEAEELNELGFVMDFRDLKKTLQEVLSRLDHVVLNEIEPFNRIPPSAENIARWIFLQLKDAVPKGVKVKKVTVWETSTSGASYWE